LKVLPTAARHGYEALLRALDKKTLGAETVLEAAERILEFKKEHLRNNAPVSITSVSEKLTTPLSLSTVEKVLEKSKR
jgi:hypothetical protein